AQAWRHGRASPAQGVHVRVWWGAARLVAGAASRYSLIPAKARESRRVTEGPGPSPAGMSGSASGLLRTARRERHADHCRASKQQIDPDKQTERPSGGFRQAGKNDAGDDEIDEAPFHRPPTP